ncbi:Endonuclease/exonuclease/phosphatase [Artemisia annua]|uniref:Endonuclease/exonuclease/phosphatase n=1 Tax=Artemisia annua TaxID=35608 RepID=A0A2U1M9X9_ARTAN|nr:Endonuclease/exonuclease/phosphatase [Artemisia annua]
MGDFNVVKSRSERVGSQFDANEAMSFNNFIANVGFHDFNLGGPSNTYFNRSGSKMKGCSTHGLVMRNSALLVSRSWNSWKGGGVADIRAVLLVCGEIKRKRSYLLLKIGMWDKKADRGLLSQNEIESHGEVLAEYHRLEHISTSKIHQKCCVEWAVEADENTRYPHVSLKQK